MATASLAANGYCLNTRLGGHIDVKEQTSANDETLLSVLISICFDA